jgi:hypothetical protein
MNINLIYTTQEEDKKIVQKAGSIDIYTSHNVCLQQPMALGIYIKLHVTVHRNAQKLNARVFVCMRCDLHWNSNKYLPDYD